MATIKSYTDITQSKKLAEFLPLETADMHWSKDFDGSWFVDLAEYTSVKIPKYVGNIEEHLLPCWSLAALLSVLPKPDLVQNSEGTWLIRSWINTYPWSVGGYSNPIDACVAMIEKLHEQNLI